MPIAANGSFVLWSTCANAISNSTDPLTGMVTCTTNQLPWFWPFLLGGLYIFLLILYNREPSRNKLASISLLVLLISVILVAGGLTPDAIWNFVIFGVIFFTSFLYKM